MTGSATVTVNPLPADFAVSGDATTCSGASTLIGLSGSQTGVTYLLSDGLTAVASQAGTGFALNFSVAPTATTTYTVLASNTTTTCTASMTGSATISVNPRPTSFAVSGDATTCNGVATPINLSGSQPGVTYLLKNGATTVAAQSGTGTPLGFSVTPTSTTTYTVLASNISTTCMGIMSGSATVTVNEPPVAPSPNISSNLASGLSLKVSITPLLAAWSSPSGADLNLQSVGSSSIQGGTVSTNGTFIFYTPPDSSIATDSISYTVADTNGCSTLASLDLTFVKSVGLVQSVTPGPTSATVAFAGIPGFAYDVQPARIRPIGA